jgi:hypothetical protein
MKLSKSIIFLVILLLAIIIYSYYTYYYVRREGVGVLARAGAWIGRGVAKFADKAAGVAARAADEAAAARTLAMAMSKGDAVAIQAAKQAVDALKTGTKAGATSSSDIARIAGTSGDKLTSVGDDAAQALSRRGAVRYPSGIDEYTRAAAGVMDEAAGGMDDAARAAAGGMDDAARAAASLGDDAAAGVDGLTDAMIAQGRHLRGTNTLKHAMQFDPDLAKNFKSFASQAGQSSDEAAEAWVKAQSWPVDNIGTNASNSAKKAGTATRGSANDASSLAISNALKQADEAAKAAAKGLDDMAGKAAYKKAFEDKLFDISRQSRSVDSTSKVVSSNFFDNKWNEYRLATGGTKVWKRFQIGVADGVNRLWKHTLPLIGVAGSASMVPFLIPPPTPVKGVCSEQNHKNTQTNKLNRKRSCVGTMDELGPCYWNKKANPKKCESMEWDNDEHVNQELMNHSNQPYMADYESEAMFGQQAANNYPTTAAEAQQFDFDTYYNNQAAAYEENTPSLEQATSQELLEIYDSYNSASIDIENQIKDIIANNKKEVARLETEITKLGTYNEVTIDEELKNEHKRAGRLSSISRKKKKEALRKRRYHYTTTVPISCQSDTEPCVEEECAEMETCGKYICTTNKELDATNWELVDTDTYGLNTYETKNTMESKKTLRPRYRRLEECALAQHSAREKEVYFKEQSEKLIKDATIKAAEEIEILTNSHTYMKSVMQHVELLYRDALTKEKGFESIATHHTSSAEKALSVAEDDANNSMKGIQKDLLKMKRKKKRKRRRRRRRRRRREREDRERFA